MAFGRVSHTWPGLVKAAFDLQLIEASNKKAHFWFTCDRAVRSEVAAAARPDPCNGPPQKREESKRGGVCRPKTAENKS